MVNLYGIAGRTFESESIHRETQRQAQWQVFIEQQECCENATKRAALQVGQNMSHVAASVFII